MWRLPLPEFWFNDYLMRDGTRRVQFAGYSRSAAVWVGGHAQGLCGARVLFRWRVRGACLATVRGMHD